MAKTPRKLIKMIGKIISGKATGKLNLHTRDEGGLKAGTMFFSNGVLHNCIYKPLEGVAAAHSLAEGTIVSATFVPGSIDDITPNHGMPNMHILFDLEEGQTTQRSPHEVEMFMEAATAVLTSIYGQKRALEKVEDMADEYPPGKAPVAFARAVYALAKNVVGEKKAKEIIRPLAKYLM